VPGAFGSLMLSSFADTRITNIVVWTKEAPAPILMRWLASGAAVRIGMLRATIRQEAEMSTSPGMEDPHDGRR
jgi:hypothetical protein